MRMIVITFQKKKKIGGGNGPFWAQKWWIVSKNFFKFCTTEKTQYVDESNNNGLFVNNNGLLL